ncbi:hypothetical protein ACH5RR_033074 [Cinchona calisaya]|uniref:Uncharacterized protein n=1 Tax=Cinchona calisaya TaxID=153742 RepID=A0ABD2YPB1_9GENT
MSEIAIEEFGEDRLLDVISNGQQCSNLRKASEECGSSEHIEELMPAELYGKLTWKIEKFSQINKRELHNNPIDVGGWWSHIAQFTICVLNKDPKKSKFSEREVTSSLVMDALYGGIKSLESRSKGSKYDGKNLVAKEQKAPIVSMEKHTIILVGDILLLIHRAVTEPLAPKDEKGSQNLKQQ